MDGKLIPTIMVRIIILEFSGPTYFTKSLGMA